MGTIYLGIAAKVNIPPVANAGSNSTFNLPTSTTTLDGSASHDPDGTIVSYLWIQVSGPSCTITNPTLVTTGVTGIAASGTYVFQLTVTDNNGATDSANTSRTVGALANINITGCVTRINTNSLVVSMTADIPPADNLLLSFTTQYTINSVVTPGPSGTLTMLAGTNTISGTFSFTRGSSFIITLAQVMTISSTPSTSGGRSIAFNYCTPISESTVAISIGDTSGQAFGFRQTGTSTFTRVTYPTVSNVNYTQIDVNMDIDHIGLSNVQIFIGGVSIGRYSGIDSFPVPAGGTLVISND